MKAKDPMCVCGHEKSWHYEKNICHHSSCTCSIFTDKVVHELAAYLPDGARVTRQTTRDYTHVVTVQNKDDGTWGVWAWTTNEKLARQYIKQANKTGRFENIVTVEVGAA